MHSHEQRESTSSLLAQSAHAATFHSELAQFARVPNQLSADQAVDAEENAFETVSVYYKLDRSLI